MKEGLHITLREKFNRLSINKKLKVFGYGIIIPFAILSVYLLFCIVRYVGSYDQIIQNVTMIKYNINFKENVDYSVYRMIVGDIKSGEVNEIEGVSNPYDSIRGLEVVVNKVYDITLGEGNKERIDRLLTIVGILKARVADIDNNIEVKGYYDENITMLDHNIRILTNIIEEHLQEYIYHEVAALDDTRHVLKGDVIVTTWASVTIFLIIFTSSNLLSIIISKSVSKPIEELCMATELIAQGDFKTRTEVAAGDEIAILTTSFNRMTEEIGLLIDNIKLEQINLKDMELKLLQEQIKPHFLYNTLDAIVWSAEAKDTEKVVRMVTSLSDFFRTALSKGNTFITLREEELHIRSYLQIQQIRYQDILEYEIRIPEEMMENQILKLTLQPLVENALYHGLKRKRTRGRILILAKREEDRMILSVEDNGIGMTEEELRNLSANIEKPLTNRKSGIGLRNVNQRIKLNYGVEYGLSVESQWGEGTKTYVQLPVLSS